MSEHVARSAFFYCVFAATRRCGLGLVRVCVWPSPLRRCAPRSCRLREAPWLSSAHAALGSKGILTAVDYGVLTQCATLEDLKVYLNNSTDYTDNFLQNEPSPLHTTTIAEHATRKLVDEFEFLRANAVEPLSTFLDYITYGYMIDNVVLLISGTLHDRETPELIEKCHPLGRFEAMEAIPVAQVRFFRCLFVFPPLISSHCRLWPICIATSSWRRPWHRISRTPWTRRISTR